MNRLRTFLSLLGIVLMLNNCKFQSSNQDEIKILNDCFLTVVDTFGYQYHTLRPGPRDSSFTNDDSLAIGVYPKLRSLQQWQTSFDAIVNTLPDTLEHKNDFIPLLRNGFKDTATNPLPVDELTQTGRYNLFPEPNEEGRRRGKIGSILFYKPLIMHNPDAAIFVADIGDNRKLHIVKVYLVRKKGKHWRVVYSDMIEVS